MRKNIFTLATLLFFAVSVMAQAPAGPGAGGAKPAAPPSIGRAFGKVTDSTGAPIDQASVILLKSAMDPVTKKPKLILVKGMDTKANGEFNFEDLPIIVPLVIKISASGYKARDVRFNIVPPGPKPGAAPAGQAQSGGLAALSNLPSFEKDLGAVKLAPDVQEVTGVTIQATPPAMKLELDKKVFNVEKNITSAGGTALDVMRNVPSVNVDIDGNVTLRGNAPTIYVDGRPTTLTLDEIPADAIESVEVMTNPSAKYDASTGGGILNIVLKKNRKQGYNGNLSAGIDSHGSPNALASFNVRQNKVNFTGTFLYNGNKSKTTGNTNRVTNLNPANTDTTTSLLENDKTKGGGGFLFGQVGADYFVTNKTTISASYLQVHGAIKPTETSQLQTDSLFNGVAGPSYYSTRYSNSNLAVNVYGAQAGMKHTFDKSGESLTADGSFFAANATSTANYLTNYYTGIPGTPVALQTAQQTLAVADPRFLTIQSDYTDPIGSKSKLEAGVRASIQKLTDDNNTYSGIGGEKLALDTLAASNYSSTSGVYAGYLNFTSAIKDFSYQLGLRGESSNYSGQLYSTDQHFKNSYPLSLFPSIFLSQKLGKTNEIQFSASRKVTRPSFFELIPYTNYSDTLNITKGNPALVPQFTDVFEFSYLKTFKHNNTLLLSVYYNYTSNLITRYQDTGRNPVGEEVLINTYENATDSYNYGAEATTTDNVTKWWDLSLNVNVYNAKINTDNLDQPSQASQWSWFGKFNNNFKLPAGFTIQLTATYQSKTNLPVNTGGQSFGPPSSATQSASQGYIKSFYGIDMAIKKTFLKNDAASVTVSMADIFRTRWSDQYSQSPYFTQEFDRLKDPQLVRVVFAYRFGKMDLNLFKRKNMNTQGMGDAGQSLQ